MKIIPLNKSSLSLPECWEDLTEKQVFFVFRLLPLLFAGMLTPFEFQLKLLMEITGYKPRRKFSEYDEETKETIQFNLIKLAEQLNFIFRLEDNKIIPLYEFRQNPFRQLSPVYFNRDVTVETNITAKQYSDCVDLLGAMHASDDKTVAEKCTVKLVAVLCDRPESEVRKMAPEFLFGMMYWFTGVYRFFREHPVFGILYNRSEGDEPDDSDKINLGMSEVILYLEKEGYAFVEDKNLIDFFNAQIKALKDSISKAVANGAKPEDIAARSGMSMYNLTRLTS